MRYLIVLGYLILAFLFKLQGQESSSTNWIERLRFQQHTLIEEADTLVYLSSQLADQPPRDTLVIFVQGSLPKPLIPLSEQGPAGIFPFNPYGYTATISFLTLSKPGVPVQPDPADLLPDFSYAPNGKFPERYLETYSLGHYVQRHWKLLDHLSQAESQERYIVLAGHSEGARIVALAGAHPAVDKLVYLSANPFGRAAGIQLEQQLRSDDGKHPAALRQALPPQGKWANLPDERSFNAPLISALLKVEKPLFVGYGTADLSSLDCAKLYWIFGDAGKGDLLNIQAWEGRGHNFFKKTATGRIDYGSFYWDEVWSQIMAWVRKK